MANPQAENGHLDLANEIVEALAKTRISGTEWQVLWVVLRKTYGWHKKEDTIPLSQFNDLTGLPKPHIVRTISALLSKMIIYVIKDDNGLVRYGFNKDFEQWKPLSKKITTYMPLSKKITPVIKDDNARYQKRQKSLSKMIPSKEKKEKKETIKRNLYGVHVELTPEEHEKLETKFGQDRTAFIIEHFNLKIESKGLRAWRKDHKSDYATILVWDRNGWLPEEGKARNEYL